MEDVNISIYRASVVREGSTPASPGFVVSDGQNPVDPSGSGQNHLPVTIAETATGLSITESQVLGGAGTVGQYIRGDGSLADFPESSGGGSSVSYYLNGSVNQGTIGGVSYKELNKVPVLGAGTDFTINADGYIASFLTDAGDPNLLEIPGGNWNFETYFSSSSSGGTPSFYVELYKYDGSTFTLLASNSSFPEFIAFGTIITPYFSTLAVPTTTLALTDRLAVRYYVTHSGRTITLHTEDNHLCQIVTTFTTGLTALNGLTAQIQNFAVGTSGTDFAISSATATHTFNLPTASATNRGALSSADWSIFNGKQNALTNPVTGTGASGQVAYFTGTTAISSESNLFWDATNNRLGINNAVPTVSLDVSGKGRFSNSGAGEGTISTSNSNSSDDSGMSNLNFDGNRLRLGVLSTDGSYGCIGSNGANTGIAFVTNNTTWSEKMRLTSGGNLLVGTISDNGAKLQVSGSGTFSSSITAGGTQYLVNTSTGTLAVYQRILNTGGDVVIGINSSLGNSLASGGLAYATAFYNNTNTALQFGTNAAFNMTIAAGGNVLIGTTSDNGARLQVSGEAKFYQPLTNTTSYLTVENNRARNAAIRLKTTVGDFLVGVGIGADTNQFQIYDNTAGANRLTINSTGAATFSSSVTAQTNLGVINANASQAGFVADFTGGSPFKVSLSTYTDTFNIYNETNGYSIINFTKSTKNLVINPTGGNVGIGTTSPDTFSYGGARSFLTFRANGTNQEPFLQLIADGVGNSLIDFGNTTIRRSTIIGLDGSHLAFFTNGSNSGISVSERLRITSGGNVLIGTTTDSGYKLNVNGGIFSTEFTSFTHTARGAGANGISDGPFFRYFNTTNSYQILKQINANTDEDTWTIRGGSWVKVGNLNATTGAYTPLSDKNKKKDFEDSTIGLNAILGLKPTLYRMKDQDKTESKQLGFIAQEVKDFIPQAYVEQENFIGLQDRPIIAALVKAIQEQQEIINDLKQKIQ